METCLPQKQSADRPRVGNAVEAERHWRSIGVAVYRTPEEVENAVGAERQWRQASLPPGDYVDSGHEPGEQDAERQWRLAQELRLQAWSWNRREPDGQDAERQSRRAVVLAGAQADFEEPGGPKRRKAMET